MSRSAPTERDFSYIHDWIALHQVERSEAKERVGMRGGRHTDSLVVGVQ